MPKSPSAGSPNSEMNRFCGLMSRCSRPRSCAVCRAPAIFTPTSSTSGDGQLPLLLLALAERAAAVQLHHDARLLRRREGGVEHRDDVRVLRHQAHRPALPLEAAPLALVGQPERQHLQGDAPVEVPLPGAEDVAEPAPADRLELVEPVDLDGRDGGIGAAGHGAVGALVDGSGGRRHGRGDRPHRNVARRRLAYGRSRSLGRGRVGCRRRTDIERAVAPSSRRHAPEPAWSGRGEQTVSDDAAHGSAHVTRRTRRSIAGSVLVVLGARHRRRHRHRAAGRGPGALARPTPTTAAPGCSSATRGTSATSTASSAR